MYQRCVGMMVLMFVGVVEAYKHGNANSYTVHLLGFNEKVDVDLKSMRAIDRGPNEPIPSDLIEVGLACEVQCQGHKYE
jgi:hypothetical protein